MKLFLAAFMQNLDTGIFCDQDLGNDIGLIYSIYASICGDYMDNFILLFVPGIWGNI